MTTTNSRKVLLPLATLVAAGAVAIGSGATFSSESTDSAISATAGDLVHSNDQDNATLTITNLKPGAVETGSLTITNTGSLDGKLKVVVGGITETDTLASALQLKIESSDLTAAAYDNNFEDADVAGGFDLGELDADPTLATPDTITVTFTVRMEADAGNEYQNAGALLDLTFTTTQTDADNGEDGNNEVESESEWVDNS